MSFVAENLADIKVKVGNGITLVAVSKTKSVELIREAYNCGQRDFGENYVQELVDKHSALPEDIHWHFIGHLQTNKVKYIVQFVYLIQGVDSLKLLSEINKQAAKYGRRIKCLLQVHIASEETKFGFSPDEIMDLAASGIEQNYPNVEVCGLMGMASNTDDKKLIAKEFNLINSLFLEMKKVSETCKTLSIGMSSDFELAIENGSTLVRIGSAIFGERNYAR